jgi:hypothetical protein
MRQQEEERRVAEQEAAARRAREVREQQQRQAAAAASPTWGSATQAGVRPMSLAEIQEQVHAYRAAHSTFAFMSAAARVVCADTGEHD